MRAKDVGHGFDCHRHVEGVGVDYAVAAARDGDVAFPEDQVAVLQAGEAYGFAERGFLHVAVARAGHAASGQRHLDEPRAVQPEAGLAAPEIRCAEKLFGDRDEIRFRGGNRHKMPLRHVAARGGDREACVLAHHRDPRAERQRVGRRQLDRGAGEHQRAQRRDLVGRRRPRRQQRGGRQPADVAVAGKLAPGPAVLVGLIDGDALAHQRLGEHRCAVRGRRCAPAPDRRSPLA